MELEWASFIYHSLGFNFKKIQIYLASNKFRQSSKTIERLSIYIYIYILYLENKGRINTAELEWNGMEVEWAERKMASSFEGEHKGD